MGLRETGEQRIADDPAAALGHQGTGTGGRAEQVAFQCPRRRSGDIAVMLGEGGHHLEQARHVPLLSRADSGEGCPRFDCLLYHVSGSLVAPPREACKKEKKPPVAAIDGNTPSGRSYLERAQ
jgi:hypothetical protein